MTEKRTAEAMEPILKWLAEDPKHRSLILAKINEIARQDDPKSKEIHRNVFDRWIKGKSGMRSENWFIMERAFCELTGVEAKPS